MINKVDRDVLMSALNLCAEEVSKASYKERSLGLLNGLSGNLLFLSELHAFDNRIVDIDKFQVKLNFLQEHLHSLKNNYDLCNGLAGVGWLIEYLNQKQGDKYDNEICSPIDDCLLEHLSSRDWLGEIELVSGLGGISVYAGRRMNKASKEQIYLKVIEHYERLLSERYGKAPCWVQPANSYYRVNKSDRNALEFNLGLAHGIPGIVASMIPALESKKLHCRAKKLISQSSEWLHSIKNDTTLTVSKYPSTHGCTSSSRLGWCYGDLTVALVFARVGKALNNKLYLSYSKKLAEHAAQRTLRKSMVQDAGICHGSLGLVLIFHELNKYVPSKKLDFAAYRWLKLTLNQYSRRGKEAFYEYSIPNQTYIESTGLLTGYSGIGLCLLAVLGQEAKWSDCLLIN